jgi:DNA-binding CsgD family transcriptional regulator
VTAATATTITAMTETMRLDDRPFVRLLHRALDLGEFFDGADRALAEVLPFDSACWLSLDPGTWLPTSHFSREFGTEHLMRLAANEYLEDDVNKFAEIARSPSPVGILSETTDGELSRSARHAQILAPYGYDAGDELRGVFRDGEAVWGCVSLHRRVGRFEPGEAALLASLGGHFVAGIRRAILRTAAAEPSESDPPGLIILDDTDSIERVTPAASRWLREIFDSAGEQGGVFMTVAAVTHQARLAAAGRADEVASVQVPTRSGGWLRLDASLLDDDPAGRVAVIIHRPEQPEVASMIVALYGLSAREREVTRLVLHGLATREIAYRLHISPYTVQDHLKSIFAKVGVSSRGELVAQLFFQQVGPRLAAGAAIAADGWFAAEV